MSKKLELEGITQQVHINIFENMTGKSNSEHFEMKVNNVLNRANLGNKLSISSEEENISRAGDSPRQ